MILFLSSRLRRRIYLRFPAPRAGFFLLSGQEKETKEKAARMARLPHCASRRNRRSPQLAGREIRASGSNTRLASPYSGCDARARHTGRVSKTSSRFVIPAEANTARWKCCYTVTSQFNMNNPWDCSILLTHTLRDIQHKCLTSNGFQVFSTHGILSIP